MADASTKKRKVGSDARRDGDNKRSKGKKQWSTPRRPGAEARNIQPGDAGIWATCAMKKEAKSVPDLRDLFQQYAEKLYNKVDGDAQEPASEDEDEDIEAAINKEVANIRKPSKNALFTSVKLDTQCLVFFKTRAPVEPVSFVEKICQDAAAGVKFHNCRYVKRLTPITACEKATSKGLDAVAKSVLAPHFHQSDQESRKFAIRPTIRNNKEFTRDEVIRTIAAAVGPGHKVDLHNYDVLIIVEIYQNIIGMSVVGPDFEDLKRYNIEELRQIANPKVSEPNELNQKDLIPIVQEE